MALCWNSNNNNYEYCTSHLSAYIAVGVIIPLGIFMVIILVYIYTRIRQRRLLRQQQRAYMSTVIPVYSMEEQPPAPYNYTYPPHYASVPEDSFGKPPSYEQTVQQISETNNNPAGNIPAILPVTTTTGRYEGPTNLTKNQN